MWGGLQPHSEGNQNGQRPQLRGFGRRLYYQQKRVERVTRNVTGCGNTIARPTGRWCGASDHRVDALLGPGSWASNGFRFDLGIASPRGENMLPLDQPPCSRRSKRSGASAT